MARQATKEINGKQFTLQSVPARWYFNFTDQVKTKNGVKSVPYVEGLLEHVVVDPKGLKFEDFDDDIGTLEELVGEIESFLRNKD